MTQAQPPPDPSAYPPDPASWRWDAAFAVACIITFASLILVGNDRAFDFDAWSAVTAEGAWSLEAVLRPHAGLWLLGPDLAYRVQLELFGTQAEAPFRAALLLLHVTTAAALYVYARSRTGRMVAFGMGVVFLLLGSASEDLYAASRMGWSVATAAGAWALVILLGPLPVRWAWLATGLLLLGVAASGVGLFFLVPAIVVLLPEPRRRYLWVAMPAVVVFVLWFAFYGHEGVATLTGAGEMLETIRVGISNSVGQVSGLGPEVGLILAVLLGLATLSTILSDTMRLGLIAGVVGLITQFALMTIAGGHAGAATALMPSGVYPAAVFILIAFSSWLAHRPLDRPGQRLRLLTVVAILVAIAMAGNVS